MKVSAELHGRDRHRRQHRADQPEADDDLRFRPAFALKMIMDGGHEEDALALAVADSGVLEVVALDDDRKSLGDEDTADEDERELVSDDDRDVRDQTAQRQRAGVTHKDARGIAIE